MILPEDHALRGQLHGEVHARPPEPLATPSRISYLALLGDREASFRAVVALAERFGVAPPAAGQNHFTAEFGDFRLKWERHTEFVRYTFFITGAGETAFAPLALAAVPADWLAALPGELMVATHVALLAAGPGDPVAGASGLFSRADMAGALVADETAVALTDFRLHDGFGRVLVLDRAMTQWQAGRVVQRLLEIDTYRMMALLALPVAQRLAPVIARCEREVAEITGAMVRAGETDEPGLLDRLTRLAAEIDSRQAETLYRFSAAAAYDDLVQGRVRDLQETRLPGLQTLREFTDRRMAPAMATCRSVASRQEELSRRVARATQLLATRVGVSRERQNQALLAAMNRRAKLQLRLQSTVEGLSIAAVTYYVTGLVGHLAEGLERLDVPVSPPLAMAGSIPVVVVLMALGLRRLHRAVAREH